MENSYIDGDDGCLIMFASNCIDLEVERHCCGNGLRVSKKWLLSWPSR